MVQLPSAVVCGFGVGIGRVLGGGGLGQARGPPGVSRPVRPGCSFGLAPSLRCPKGAKGRFGLNRGCPPHFLHSVHQLPCGRGCAAAGAAVAGRQGPIGRAWARGRHPGTGRRFALGNPSAKRPVQKNEKEARRGCCAVLCAAPFWGLGTVYSFSEPAVWGVVGRLWCVWPLLHGWFAWLLLVVAGMRGDAFSERPLLHRARARALLARHLLRGWGVAGKNLSPAPFPHIQAHASKYKLKKQKKCPGPQYSEGGNPCPPPPLFLWGTRAKNINLQ